MKFLFVGNRKFVLDEMLKSQLDITEILVIKGTYLETHLTNLKINYTSISSKQELIDKINSLEFDILISNGCPYILPISNLVKKKYVNIHPSFLPDLKGADPVLGSILFQRDSGATCHAMNDEIDDGDIISQVKIPFSDDLDVSLLYQLSFLAEKEVFQSALKNNFEILKKQKKQNNLIYFTKQPENQVITFKESNQEIINKIRAFSNNSQGCNFKYKGTNIKVYAVQVLENKYLEKLALKFDDLQIILSYENSIVFKKDGLLLRFYNLKTEKKELEVLSYLA